MNHFPPMVFLNDYRQIEGKDYTLIKGTLDLIFTKKLKKNDEVVIIFDGQMTRRKI